MEADDAQKMRKENMTNAEKDPDLETFCFDLEKTLPLPRIPTNIVYYKRQLCIYNLGIHSGKDNKGHCYVWVEGEAGRGSQEVGSCLVKHFKENVHSAKKLIFCPPIVAVDKTVISKLFLFSKQFWKTIHHFKKLSLDF